MPYMLQTLYIITFIITFSVALDISISSVNVSRENKTNNTMQNNDLLRKRNPFLIYVPALLVFGSVLGCLIYPYYCICWKKFKINFRRFRNDREYIVTQRRKLKKSNKLWGKWYIDYNDKRIKKYKSQHKDKNKFLIKYQRRNNNIDQEMTEFIDYAWNENTDESKNTCRIKHLNPEVTVSTHAQNLESSSSSSGSTSNCIITVAAQVHTEENDN